MWVFPNAPQHPYRVIPEHSVPCGVYCRTDRGDRGDRGERLCARPGPFVKL
jgi:hypothetical protein